MHRLKRLKDAYKGDTCVIIGNGPSLRDVDLESLPFKTFGANMLIDDYYPTYLTCVDQLMLHSFVPEVDVSKSDLVFVPAGYPVPGTVRLNIKINMDFSRDPTEQVFLEGTVTYVNMQLAYWMGFRRALLVGMDHNYPGAGVGGKPGTRFIQDGPDQDHYSTNYFKHGRIYARPALEHVAKYTFPMAKRAWEGDGREIINCSTFTTLKVFPTEKLEKFL